MIERRIEQLDQSGVAADQALIHRLHRLARALRIAGAADDRPALRQGIDLTFRIGLRAERLAVVEVGAAIPLAVPGVLLDVFLQLLRLRRGSVRRRQRPVALPRQLGKLRQHVVEEEGEPDAFAAAVFADQVHAVVPIAAAHQRQAVFAEFQAVLDGAHAMFVERGRLLASGSADRSRLPPPA